MMILCWLVLEEYGCNDHRMRRVIYVVVKLHTYMRNVGFNSSMSEAHLGWIDGDSRLAVDVYRMSRV